MSHGRAVLTALVAVLALPAYAAGQTTPTYVTGDSGGSGDDVNPCSFNASCLTWPGAITKTSVGGTIIAKTSGLFSFPTKLLTITGSITIDGNGVLAAALSTSHDGIVVSAGTSSDVVLKGVTLRYSGPCSAGSFSGVKFLGGHTLTIQDSVIEGFPGAGVDLEPANGHGTVTIKNTVISSNCTAGVLARATGGDLTARVENDVITGNPTGVLAGDGTTVTLTNSTLVGNATETATDPGAGTLTSLGDNRIGGIAGTAGSAVPGPTPTPTPTPTPPGDSGTPTGDSTPPNDVKPKTPKPKKKHCIVPKLSGLTVTAATKALRDKHCARGVVHYQPKRGKQHGRIYAQSLRAGASRTAKTKVDVTISAHKPKTHAKHRAVGTVDYAWVADLSRNASDANAAGFHCDRAHPCLTFAVARDQVAQNGTVGVVGDIDLGPITIDHSIAVDGKGYNVTTSGVTINAGATDPVELRNLTVKPAAPCSAPGAGDGIVIQQGGPLHLENVTVSGFPGTGVTLAPPASTSVVVHGGSITNNCTAGLSATRPGGSIAVTIDNATVTGNGTGLVAGDGALIQLARSTITGNTTAFGTSGTGDIQAWSGNTTSPNGAAGWILGTLPFS